MKEIITEAVVQTKKYIGNCPICGKEQIDNYKMRVDVECIECKNNRIVGAIKYLKSIGFDVEESYTIGNIYSLRFNFNGNKYCIETDCDDSYMYIRDAN